MNVRRWDGEKRKKGGETAERLRGTRDCPSLREGGEVKLPTLNGEHA